MELRAEKQLTLPNIVSLFAQPLLHTVHWSGIYKVIKTKVSRYFSSLEPILCTFFNWSVLSYCLCESPEIWTGQNRSPILCANNYGKRIKITHGCLFEGWPNRAWPIQPIYDLYWRHNHINANMSQILEYYSYIMLLTSTLLAYILICLLTSIAQEGIKNKSWKYPRHINCCQTKICIALVCT